MNKTREIHPKYFIQKKLVTTSLNSNDESRHCYVKNYGRQKNSEFFRVENNLL